MTTLLNYLNQVKQQSLIETNFNLITHAAEYQSFKDVFYDTPGVCLISDKIDDLLRNTVR